MTSRATHWILRAGAVGAVLLMFGCSSSKPYALVAQLPAGDHLVVGAITVNDGQCTASFASLDWADFYKPSCKVVKDQSGFKSFNINGTQLDFGAGDNNGFKLLTSPPKLPAPDVAAAPAAATGAKPAAPAPAPAASTAAPAAGATGENFPGQWMLAPHPGNQHLAGQAPGYLLASDNLVVQGGDATLDVTFKTPAYKPLHMFSIVTANEKGDFRLVFNPHLTSTLTAGGNYDVSMVSEGEGISGTVWDSHGFDSWTPSLPTTWAVKSEDNKQ